MHTLTLLRTGALHAATSLKLSESLTHFPQEIFELADTLEVLDLSGNKLSTLPMDFGRLKKLRILFCSDNLFTTLPEVLADCPLLDIVGFKANRIDKVPARSLNANIRWLILTNNAIADLPAEIGRCYRMQKLMLAGNRLGTLPQELGNCRNLSLLRISANRLQALPEWLLAMPKLAWLAFSGNLFSTGVHTASATLIDWHELELQHVLGEGASGVIYKGIWHSGADSKDVAVKLFKGAVTSDGLPEDEMNTFIAAGCHPGLVQLIGQAAGHPEEKKGLVMELIGKQFTNLGMPPSFASCTRDVFADGQHLSTTQALNISRTIASVASRLHSRGIMHGDLYAHNILADNTGNALFGDFGAACFYDIADTGRAAALERIEVSAFGYLLEDLLSLCKDPGDQATIRMLEMLGDKCIAPDISARPAFQEISRELIMMKG